MKEIFKFCEYVPFLLLGLFILEEKGDIDFLHEKVQNSILKIFFVILIAWIYVFLLSNKCSKLSALILCMILWIIFICIFNRMCS